ncbi:rod shape-determining protein [Halorientalis litorea]|uniref:rod shape-determining protein n=1 Tax=Halorientalis litorea TaxID=2931977 RepID=UPI001FF3EAB8|nr:rod shape-determining protein [Halorientalis litorea]
MSEDTSDKGPGEDEARTDTEDGTDEPAPLGVKLGSTRTAVVGADGPVTTTLTCLATYEDVITGEEQVVYGEQAAEEYPDRVEYMLRSGLPEDDERATLAERFFSEVVSANDLPADSVVVYAIPSIDNEPGLANLEAVVEGSDIGERLVRSYPESLCGAVPALGDGLEAIERIFIGVNLGSTNLEACAYRRGDPLTTFATGAVTGNEVDRRIANYVEEETQGRVNIDLTTARTYKEEHADFLNYEPFTDIIQQPGGGSHEFTIEQSVPDAVDEYVDEAVDELANSFLPQMANDHLKTYQQALDGEIVLTGGMACIPGIVDEFEDRLAAELDRDVTCVAPDEPVTAAASGAQRIAEKLTERGAY